MADTRYSKEEIETIVSYNQATNVADVYSSDKRYIAHMKALKEKYPEKVILLHEDECGASFSVPKKWVKVRPPRVVSEEQRMAAAERLKAYRKGNPPVQ